MSLTPNTAATTLPATVSPDAVDLRIALGRFATGVTVVTTRSGLGDRYGLTANSFSALSLDPPLILWSLRLGSSSLAVFQKNERFMVNVLAAPQLEISRLFSSNTPDKFSRVAHSPSRHGLPLLHGTAAWFECRQVSHQTAGDHCLFIAQVERFSSSLEPPLVFHSGTYFGLGSRL